MFTLATKTFHSWRSESRRRPPDYKHCPPEGGDCLLTEGTSDTESCRSEPTGLVRFSIRPLTRGCNARARVDKRDTGLADLCV